MANPLREMMWRGKSMSDLMFLGSLKEKGLRVISKASSNSVVVMDDRLGPVAVRILFLDDGGAVDRLALFDNGGSVSIISQNRGCNGGDDCGNQSEGHAISQLAAPTSS